MSKDNLTELGQHFWQFEIGGVPLPHLKTRGVIGRREGEWRLKVWGERLLFCADDAPEKVFAVATPYIGQSEIAEFWRVAAECGDFGELTMTSREMGRPKGFFNSLILRANSGRSWVRDWCGGDWLEFKGPKWQLNLATPDDKTSLAASESAARIELWQRSFAGEKRGQSPLWLRGSQEEWSRVLQACATLHYKRKPEDSYGLKINSGKCVYFFYSQAPFDQGFMDGIEDYDTWEIPDDWQLLFVQNFVFVGWSWERYEKRVDGARNAWNAESASVAVDIQLSFQPSQHEKLEAQLFLRDWLRGKVPVQQIEKLLG